MVVCVVICVWVSSGSVRVVAGVGRVFVLVIIWAVDANLEQLFLHGRWK